MKLKKATNIFCLAALPLLLVGGCRTNAPQADAHASWLRSWRATNSVWRGVHLSAHNDTQAAQLMEALSRLAAAGANVVVLEVDYDFEFQSHPEVRGSEFITRARAQELAQAARTNGIRLIPQLNCLGHQSWGKTTAPLLLHHPEFDETPGQFPDNKDIYCRSWCPQNPDVTRLACALIDELIDAFEADAFHVGMDEVFIIGSDYCPRCRGADRAKLLAQQINALHHHIVGERKCELLMWGDRLLDAKALGYSKWEASMNGTQNAVDLIPKDIIMCDWHYEKRTEYTSVPLLMQKGFRVWPSGWQPLEAAKAFSAYARSQSNPRMLGYLCTTWGKVKIPDTADWPPFSEVINDWRR